MATSAGQCAPGAKLGGAQEITVKNRGDDPTKKELDRAANSGLLPGNELNVPGNYRGPRGAGDGAVSPPKTSNYVSGNAVLRRVGASGVPITAVNATGLGAAPFETYIKMLVSSELAAQGIPTNEPFQINTVRDKDRYMGT